MSLLLHLLSPVPQRQSFSTISTISSVNLSPCFQIIHLQLFLDFKCQILLTWFPTIGYGDYFYYTVVTQFSFSLPSAPIWFYYHCMTTVHIETNSIFWLCFFSWIIFFFPLEIITASLHHAFSFLCTYCLLAFPNFSKSFWGSLMLFLTQANVPNNFSLSSFYFFSFNKKSFLEIAVLQH